MESHSVNSVDPFKNKTKSWTLKENVKLKKKRQKEALPRTKSGCAVCHCFYTLSPTDRIPPSPCAQGICWNRRAQCAGPLSWEAMLRQAWEAMGHCLSPHETSHPQTASRLSPLRLPASYRTMLPVMATESSARPPAPRNRRFSTICHQRAGLSLSIRKVGASTGVGQKWKQPV